MRSMPTSVQNTLDTLAGRIDAIVIGASAGGVEALLELLPALPAGAATSTFVVLHLPRERPSLLVDVFAPKCGQPVYEAQDKEPIVHGSIYFAPPDYHLLVDAGPQLALSADEPVNFSRPAIDVLFESAADYYRERLLGIVLTGGNNDGALGLQAVRKAGGMTIVQDPDEAQARFMPELALRQGEVDAVLTLVQIAALLRTLAGEKNNG